MTAILAREGLLSPRQLPKDLLVAMSWPWATALSARAVLPTADVIFIGTRHTEPGSFLGSSGGGECGVSPKGLMAGHRVRKISLQLVPELLLGKEPSAFGTTSE